MEYVPALADYAHQTRAKAKMRGKAFFALLMAMRTGKTKTTIDDWGVMELEGEVNDLLVVAPTGVYRTWKGQLEEHASADLRDRMLLHTWETHGGVGHDNALKRFMALSDRRRPRTLLMNLEGFVTKRARDLAVEFASQRRTEVAVDESTGIKNMDAKRTQFVLDRIKPVAAYRRILSGLPAPRDPLDLYAQFEFLDHSILRVENYWHFRMRYSITKTMRIGARKHLVTVGFRNIDKLHGLIEPHSFRIRLDEIVDLPSAYMFRDVTMTDDQQRVYAALKRDAIAELEEGQFINGQMVVVRMLRLHQILCGFTRTTDGELREIKENRTQELLDLMEEYDGKAVIWCSYDYSVNKVSAALRKAYGDDSVAQFWGGNSRTRETDDERFQRDERCRFMVATPGSGGRGRKWSMANLVVYYSSTDNLEHRDQSEERAKDMAKTDNTLYVDLRVRGTVDERIIKALRMKMNMAATITHDTWKEWLI